MTLPKLPTRPPDDVVESWPESARRYVGGLERVLGQLVESVRVGEDAVREAKRQAVPFRRPASKRATKRGKPGRKGGHAVQRRAIPPTIDEEVVSAAPDTCACGGTNIVEAGSYEQLQEDLEVRRVTRRITVFVGRCTMCGTTCEDRHPLQTSKARGAAAHQLGPTAMALATQLHYQEGVPFERIASIFAELGLPVAKATLVRGTQRIAKRGESAFEGLLQQILREEVLHVDETSWSVDGEPCYLWVLSGAKGTVYFVRETRSGDEIADFLEDFAGVIVTDGHAGYDALAQKLLRALCLLHLRRNMKSLEAKNVARGKTLARDLTWWLDAAITLVGQRSELSEEFFVQQARDLEEQFFEILSVRTSSPSNIRMVSRMLKWQDAILRSLRDPRVPATNNQAERRIRPAVVLRKRGGCNRSARGARTFERLASIAITLRQQRRSFMEWIASLLISPTPPPLFA